MRHSQRRIAILERLEAVGACSYQDLTLLLGVSEMTVRRDVDKLVADGGVIKTLGGVQSAHGPKHFYESPVKQRLSVDRKSVV